MASNNERFRTLVRDQAAVFFTSIARLARLQMDDHVPVEISEELNKEKLVQLGGAGLLPRISMLRENYPEIIDFDIPSHQDRPAQIPLARTTVLEILGEYLPGSKQNKIVIYTRLCDLVASALEVDPAALHLVVLAHEIAHTVTHLGKEADGHIWDHFENADDSDTELFAQLYPFRHFSRSNQVGALDAFLLLDGHQVGVYNRWRDWKRTSIDDVNTELLAARRRQGHAKPLVKPPAKSFAQSFEIRYHHESYSGYPLDFHSETIVFRLVGGLLVIEKNGTSCRVRMPQSVIEETISIIEQSRVMRLPGGELGFSSDDVLDCHESNKLKVVYGGIVKNWRWGRNSNGKKLPVTPLVDFLIKESKAAMENDAANAEKGKRRGATLA